MSFLRRAIDEMTGYVPGEQPPAGARVIKLNTNENPYPPSPRVADAISRELEDGARALRRYPDPAATEFRRAAAEATGFPLEGILAGNGSDELLALILRAAVEPGEAVAYPTPTYALYETLALGQGARIVTCPMGDDFALPDALFGCDARVVLVASPNSPSGVIRPVSRLDRLAQSMPDSLLVIDEAYVDFASGGALELAQRRSNVVVTRTLSKSHSLAGMRLGLLFGPPELVHGLAKIRDSYNLDRLAIAAGAAALRDPEWMHAHVERIRATRDKLVGELRELGFDVVPSEANFVFARLPTAERARATYRNLEDRGILVRYFDRPPLDRGIRITVGTDDEIDALLAALRGD